VSWDEACQWRPSNAQVQCPSPAAGIRHSPEVVGGTKTRQQALPEAAPLQSRALEQAAPAVRPTNRVRPERKRQGTALLHKAGYNVPRDGPDLTLMVMQ